MRKRKQKKLTRKKYNQTHIGINHAIIYPIQQTAQNHANTHHPHHDTENQPEDQDTGQDQTTEKNIGVLEQTKAMKPSQDSTKKQTNWNSRYGKRGESHQNLKYGRKP